MAKSGWKQLIAGASSFQGDGRCPIAAYSEFIPPPRIGPKPYGGTDGTPFADDDPWGWPITEYEEAYQLRPGLEKIAREVVGALVHLANGRAAHGIAKNKLTNNPYWPAALAERAGSLEHERFVVLAPLALSRTQDDKGRLRWTLFGGSEQGPARGFWKGFWTAPGRQAPEDAALEFLRSLLGTVFGETAEKPADLRRAGFRILPGEGEMVASSRSETAMPSWTEPYLWAKRQPVRAVKYLLTFQPFAALPAAVRRAYLAGELHLLPFPGSLLFWGVAPFYHLQQELLLATQIPLLHLLPRHEDPYSIRVPQSGWMHEPRPGLESADDRHGPVRNTYTRTHRWARVHRNEDELTVLACEDKLAHVLFSTAGDDLGLYGKPMARNVQLWTRDFRLLLDGPRADAEEIQQAARTVAGGGLFGYRFQFPAMRVGVHEVYWHRPLAAYFSAESEQAELLDAAPLGYLTAYRADRPNLDRAVELWPRLLRRQEHLPAVQLFEHGAHCHQTALNCRKLLDSWHLLGERPLPRSFARQLLTLAKHQSLEDWLNALPEHAASPEAGRAYADVLQSHLEPAAPAAQNGRRLPEALTFGQTARRSFEVAYWKTIAFLAEGKFINKDNADCVRDPATQAALTHPHRDLEALGDYLLGYYRRTIEAKGMAKKALAGDLPFHWRTDFNFALFGGWLNNQEGQAEERDLLVVVPGRDRRRAVIMADHYDTAYMADHFDPHYGGTGARLAAAGADDNHSATTALMLAAPIFLDMSRAGRLACDVWLIHLTGEEFPADCLGARHLCQRLVERNLEVRLAGGARRDLSGVQVQGVYVLDMVAHNNDRDRDVFQISPGTGRESLWLAYQAHLANEIWNASAPAWNRRPARRGCGRGRRSPFGSRIPDVALHPHLHGEVRPAYDPRSTLYNTDGQIFSDAGVPVVLFMENYDINRTGYHDSHDTMANIDLDYGAAVAAITIESVARAATQKAPGT